MKKITVVIPIGAGMEMEAVESLKNQKESVSIIVEEGTNPSENRNRGAKKAQTQFIAFVDAHTIPLVNWSKKILDFFDKHKEIDIVGGPQLTPKDESRFGRVTGYAFCSIFGSADVGARYQAKKKNLDAGEKDLTSANLICRSEVFKKIKFDKNLYPGEDPKFISDAKKEGFGVAYDPEIAVYHRKRGTPKALAIQIFNYGITRTKKERLAETLIKPSFLIPSFFVIYLLLIFALSLISKLLIFPFILYFFLSFFFSFYEAMKNKDFSSFFLLPWVFFNIHVSYGLGFIVGTLDKIGKDSEHNF